MVTITRKDGLVIIEIETEYNKAVHIFTDEQLKEVLEALKQ